MRLALFVVVVACATVVAMADVGKEPAPTTILAPTTSTVKTTPITQIHPTRATTTKMPMTTTTAAPIVAIAMADAPKLADTTKAPMTTVAPKPAETTTATTDTPKRWSRNPRSNTTTTQVPTTVIATTIEPPTTKVVTDATKVPETTTTDKLTLTTIDKPRYRRSEPVITTTLKPKALLPTKPESNETTLWFAATKSDEEWKNATFARERKHGENGTEDWDVEGTNENREEITIAIIEKYERTTILRHEGPATNETTAVIKKDEDFVDIDAPTREEKEVDTDTDDDDDDDDDLPKGATAII